jgi:selenide,water dikinase
MALNLMMFSQEKIPQDVFGEILKGGQSKISEAGALIVGGHTLDDHPPKYGLAVLGTVHPGRLITNAGARANDVLLLTKSIGTGALASGQRNGLCSDKEYKQALKQMKKLNRHAASLAARYGVSGMTDITGFGLAGHAMKMAEASGVSFRIRSLQVPLLPGAYQVFDRGSIPGAAFRNLEFTGNHAHFARGVDYNIKMLLHDAQTSGGLLMAVNPDHAASLLSELNGIDPDIPAMEIGEVLPESPRRLYIE